MSEADSPNDQSGSPAPTEPIALTAALDTSDPAVSSADRGDDWQTVDFPGAMSVDAIPLSAAESVEQELAATEPGTPSFGVIHYSNAAIGQATMSLMASSETPDDATVRQQLQNENAALRDRLAQVELDLVQQQIEWQLESACTQVNNKTVLGEAVAGEAAAGEAQPSTLDLTEERQQQLLQELERSRQTTQRQQILVETLTEQLESSQERIAQLERDCALTQQRHNEQVQQVLQAESACRDLRLRLHRQQQQTLQFKAALEKCLEMPTVYGQSLVPDMAIDDSAETTDAFAALLQLKHQPVKPWSLPQRATDERENGLTELPKPLFQLLNGLSAQSDGNSHPADALTAKSHSQLSGEVQGAILAAPVDSSALVDSDDPQFVTQLMQLIFPDGAEQHVYTTADALQGEPVFDVSSFLETETAQANAAPTVAVSRQNEIVSPKPTIQLPVVSLDASETVDQRQNNLAPSSTDAIAPPPTTTTPVERVNDPLWADLTAVIEPPAPIEGASAVETDEVSERLAKATAESVQDTLTQKTPAAPMANRLIKAAPSNSVGIPPFFTASTTAVTSTELASTAELASLDTAIEPDRMVEPKHATEEKKEGTTKPIAAWTWRDRLEKASQLPRSTAPEKASPEEASPEKVAQNPAKYLALSSVSRQTFAGQPTVSQPSASQPIVDQTAMSQPSASLASSPASTPTPFSTVVPSPIVYPLRSTKKLDSLAAVDLPSFPKR